MTAVQLPSPASSLPAQGQAPSALASATSMCTAASGPGAGVNGEDVPVRRIRRDADDHQRREPARLTATIEYRDREGGG